MIDLGLPSGTKWACCNAGASKPEDYGGYYEWGQIADAPSLAQIRELINSCSSVWTTLNGVHGRLFTGPNGRQVFLPAAGYRWYGEFYNVGSIGHYWSGTLIEGSDPNDSSAHGLGFDSGDVLWYGIYRDCGLSVRPVAR
ncbi:MAG: hypothetical protein Q4E44_03840 [bacterium]|nr:hypothetical protein [bacterium]